MSVIESDAAETRSERPSAAEMLKQLEIVIGQQPGDLGIAIRQLDQWAKVFDGQLGHFLQRRSYVKAHAYLEGKGGCGE